MTELPARHDARQALTVGELVDARVVAAHGRHFLVRALHMDGNPEWLAVSRARRSDCVVGDLVRIGIVNGDQAVIEEVRARAHTVQRSDMHRTKILATHVDQAAVIISGSPMYDEALLVRALISIAAADIPALVIATKRDLWSVDGAGENPATTTSDDSANTRANTSAYTDANSSANTDADTSADNGADARQRFGALLEKRLSVLESLGYPVLRTASRRASRSGNSCHDDSRGGHDVQEAHAARTLDPADLAQLRARFDGRRTLLLGESGMGKSTLLNALVPTASQQTQAISEALGSGRHTTTFTKAFDLPRPMCGLLIDSPGYQNFEIEHLSHWEMAHAMPDFAPLIGQCRFNNCAHHDEPGCAVRAAAENGAIDPLRYRLYLGIQGAGVRGSTAARTPGGQRYRPR